MQTSKQNESFHDNPIGTSKAEAFDKTKQNWNFSQIEQNPFVKFFQTIHLITN